MQLKTLLLPTGEFALVVTGWDGPLPDEDQLARFRHFRDDTGAVAVWVSNDDVETFDAFFDENARRAPEKVELIDTNPPRAFPWPDHEPELPTLVNKADALSNLVDDLSKSDDPADRILADQLDRGAEFSPAGLVTSGGTGRNNILEGEINHVGRPQTHYVDVKDFVVGADPEGWVVASTPAERAAKFEPGTDVEITGPTVYHTESFQGEIGTVRERTYGKNDPRGLVLVELGGVDERPFKRLFPVDSVRRLNVTPREDGQCCYPAGVTGPACDVCPLVEPS